MPLVQLGPPSRPGLSSPGQRPPGTEPPGQAAQPGPAHRADLTTVTDGDVNQ
jgi:hypothetical protein